MKSLILSSTLHQLYKKLCYINFVYLIFQVEHILTFLDEFAKNIVMQGVHMVYNAQVRHGEKGYEYWL